MVHRKNLIVILFSALLIASTAHAGSWNGWIYQDPYPTSNHLHAVKFITPKKGWIAGEQGVILYTEDGGDSWEAQESGTEQMLSSITFINEKTGWAVGEKGIIVHTDDGGKSWKPQAETYQFLVKVFFLNEQDGWAAGHDAILRTTDGGKNWVRQYARITGTIASIHFINPKTGWVLAGGKVYWTLDGGEKWDFSTLPRSEYPIAGAPGLPLGPVPDMAGDKGDIYFTDGTNGWAVVGFGLIFHTNDGGKTWVNQLHTGPASYGLNRLSFTGAKKGCATGSSILCTEDGGKTWNERLGVPAGSWKGINDFLFVIEFHNVSLIDQSIGWAVGERGQIWKTENGGKTWKLASRHDECGGKTFFINKKTGWFFANYHTTYICRTDDSGLTRQKQEVGLNVWGLFFLDNMTGWAAGVRKNEEGEQKPGISRPGKVWAVIKNTTDGGQIWKTQFEELISKDLYDDALFDVFFADRNRGWAVGQKGFILHTRNGGKQWERQKGGTNNLDLRHVYFINAKIGWVSGIMQSNGWVGTVLYTKNGGEDWQTQLKKRDVGLHGGLLFLDDKNGWATGETETYNIDDISDGRLLYTTDGGKTWTEKKFQKTGLIYPAFLDKDRGILSSETGWIIVTNDGGKTWKQIREPIRKYPWPASQIFETKY